MYVSFYNLGLIILPHAPFSPVFLPSELLPQIAHLLTRQSPLTPNTPHHKLLIDFFLLLYVLHQQALPQSIAHNCHSIIF